MPTDDTPAARPPIGDEDAVVFSYGTLQNPAVQRELFGDELPGEADEIADHRLEWVTITDPEVVRMSGNDRHPILRSDPDGETVSGTALLMTAEQLRRADDYEVDDYVRVRVGLVSGRSAWVYTRRSE